MIGRSNIAGKFRIAPHRIALGLMVLGVMVAGCSLREPAFEPHATLSVSQYTGTPLSGPTTQVADVTKPGDAIFVAVRVYAIEELSVPGLRPVVSDARLIVLSPTGRPLAATGRLTRSFRWGTGAAADHAGEELNSGALGRSVEIGQCAVAVAPGATTVVGITNAQATPQIGIVSGVRILLNCSAPGQLEPAVAAAGLIQEATSSDDQGDDAEERGLFAPKPAGELAILPPISVEKPATAAMLMPFEFSDARLRGLLVFWSASPGRADDPQLASALAKSAAELVDSAKFTANSSQASLSDLSYWSAMQVAIQGLSDPARRRASFSYLAARTNAGICEDFALVADDQALARLVAIAQPRLAQAAASGNTGAAQWALDESALQLMDKMQEDNRLPPELLSVLARNVGEPAMNPGSMDDILDDSHDSQDLRIRLIAENFNYLDDNSPAARARAFDWLSEHGAAPAGYDPLGPHAQRQAALEQAYDALVQPGGTNP